MKHKKILLIFIILAFCSIFFYNPRPTRVTATVARVIDGDTAVLANGDKVRLLGIDAPEEGNYYYKQSKDRLRQLIEGKTVSLERDVSNVDDFGRLLRYLFVDKEFVNLKMVKEGYAYAYVVAPDEKYIKELVKAEEEARKKQLVIWKSSMHSSCIYAKINYNAKGDDNENLNDEFIIFKNLCDYEIDMNNWLVKDEQGNKYTFTKFVLLPGHIVTLYSGSGIDTDSQLYWNSKKPIWNNEGDTLYLRDAKGKMIIKQTYGKR